MSRGGLLGGDRGSGRGGDDREGGGEGEGGDVGMAHTGSTMLLYKIGVGVEDTRGRQGGGSADAGTRRRRREGGDVRWTVAAAGA
jgi:hypothetical protein